jgi:hypothetical protein
MRRLRLIFGAGVDKLIRRILGKTTRTQKKDKKIKRKKSKTKLLRSQRKSESEPDPIYNMSNEVFEALYSQPEIWPRLDTIKTIVHKPRQRCFYCVAVNRECADTNRDDRGAA